MLAIRFLSQVQFTWSTSEVDNHLGRHDRVSQGHCHISLEPWPLGPGFQLVAVDPTPNATQGLLPPGPSPHVCTPHAVMQQVLADDARERLLHLVRLLGCSSDLLEGAVGVPTLVSDQQMQFQVGLPICKRKGHIVTVTARRKQACSCFTSVNLQAEQSLPAFEGHF